MMQQWANNKKKQTTAHRPGREGTFEKKKLKRPRSVLAMQREKEKEILPAINNY